MTAERPSIIRLRWTAAAFALAVAVGALPLQAEAGAVKKGAGWGALGGAVIGGVAGGKPLAGAAAGAATGALIGKISK